MLKIGLDQYSKCRFIREFERALARAFEAGEVPGLLHLGTGAELADVILAAHLQGGQDFVTGSHRSHGIALAMGADPEAVAKEILGRVGGLSDGMAGTQHLIAPEVGFLSSNGIVGGQVPIAAGAALSAKLLRPGGVGVAIFGDGAANQGAVLETMNLAHALALPMVFVMHNNGLAQSTECAAASGGTDLTARARGFGLAAYRADGPDAASLSAAIGQAVATARGGKASFVELPVARLDGHYFGEDQAYLEQRDCADPLDSFRDSLQREGIGLPEIEAVDARARETAQACIDTALHAKKAGKPELAAWVGLSEAVNG